MSETVQMSTVNDPESFEPEKSVTVPFGSWVARRVKYDAKEREFMYLLEGALLRRGFILMW